jgi:hypothetical protein
MEARMDKRVSAQARRRQEEFTRLAARAAREVGGPEPTDEEIVEAVKRTREALYRERYDTA